MSAQWPFPGPSWRVRAIAMCVVAGAATASRVSGQQEPVWTLSAEARELGAGADELFQFVRFGRFLPDGSAVVADAEGLFLRVYGPDGTRRSTMGSRGAGPGEFRAIHGLWITTRGMIGVWDGRSRRLTTFDPGGGLVSTHPARPEEMAGNLEPLLGSFGNGDILLASLRLERLPGPAEVVPERWVLGRFSPEGVFRGSLGEVRGMYRMQRAPVPFSPVPWVAVRADSIWVIDGYDVELKVRAPGGDVVRTVELPWRVRPSRSPWSALEAGLRRGNRELYLTLLASAPRTDEFPGVGGLMIDDGERVWVKEYDPYADVLWLKRNALHTAPGGTWRVLGPDGTWLAAVRMPDDLIPLDIAGNRLLGVERDDLDVERVVVRTVVR